VNGDQRSLPDSLLPRLALSLSKGFPVSSLRDILPRVPVPALSLSKGPRVDDFPSPYPDTPTPRYTDT
jgi:hypothetical protein